MDDYYTRLVDAFRKMTPEQRKATIEFADFLRLHQQPSQQGEEVKPSDPDQVPGQS